MKARTIAAGVFVGTWLWVISAILVMLLLASLFDVPTDSFLPTTTTLAPPPGG